MNVVLLLLIFDSPSLSHRDGHDHDRRIARGSMPRGIRYADEIRRMDGQNSLFAQPEQLVATGQPEARASPSIAGRKE